MRAIRNKICTIFVIKDLVFYPLFLNKYIFRPYKKAKRENKSAQQRLGVCFKA